MVVFYSNVIYGGMNPMLGGGAPATVSLRSSRPGLREVRDAGLIEETELGFYIICTDPFTRGTLFIPRSSVQLVIYRSRGFEAPTHCGAEEVASPTPE